MYRVPGLRVLSEAVNGTLAAGCSVTAPRLTDGCGSQSGIVTLLILFSGFIMASKGTRKSQKAPLR